MSTQAISCRSPEHSEHGSGPVTPHRWRGDILHKWHHWDLCEGCAERFALTVEVEPKNRPPQFRDRVEVIKTHTFGEVREVRKSEVKTGYSFFILPDGSNSGGWYTAAELRLIVPSPASDPNCYK